MRLQNTNSKSLAPGGALTLLRVFAILKSPARYPSGPRERSAKPPFVGSNPTRASNNPKHLDKVTCFPSVLTVTETVASRNCSLDSQSAQWLQTLPLATGP